MKIVNFNNTDKMYTYLRGYCEGKNYVNAIKALPYARDIHANTFRKSGEPYLVHPLGVVLYGLNIGLDSDSFVTAGILHDTEEEKVGCDLHDLDIEPEIKRSVDLLTFRRNLLIEKRVALQMYYEKIWQDEVATFIKFLDRYNNLSTMTQTFTLEKIENYAEETREFIYPGLEIAKRKYPHRRDELYILKHNISSLVNTVEGMFEFIPDEEMKRERIKKEM